MTAGWVAGGARGRLLTRRRLGVAGARRLATADGPDAAVTLLARTPYGRDVRIGQSVERARRAVGDVCVWHLRVLAGWLPPGGGEVVRVFAGRFEFVNVADHLAELAGERPPRHYELGAVATAWPRVAAASTPAQVRAALAGSPWGDPGTTDPRAAEAALEVGWAAWLAAVVPGAGAWAAGWAAMSLARQVTDGREPAPGVAAVLRRVLGRSWEGAGDLDDLVARLPPAGAWVLEGIAGPEDLWRVEGRWWQRVDRDSAAILRRGRPGPGVAAAASARLVADAWRVQAGLEAAAWGPAGVEVFDAVA